VRAVKTSRSTRSRVVGAGLLLLATVVALVVVQVVRVHHATGELRLTPSAAPPEIHEFGRDCKRGDLRAPRALPRGARQVDSTAGGGDVLVWSRFALQGPPTHVVPTVIWVRDDSGRLWTCALVGGP